MNLYILRKECLKAKENHRLKKQNKYLQFQSHVLVLFYKVIFPFSAYIPLQLLLLWVGEKTHNLNKDLES